MQTPRMLHCHEMKVWDLGTHLQGPGDLVSRLVRGIVGWGSYVAYRAY